ncbi:Prephenate dehydratase [Chitinispirillum alkaliphilum]|nr:Prephenate dehydratase [Chitinispirillum alkaliphilum]
MSIAFPGERGAFSELAAKEYFGDEQRTVAYSEFEQVFQAVKDGEHTFGIVPIENSFAGSIYQNYDFLLESGLNIAGEIYLRIHHHLMANKGCTINSIKQVYSHPQAFAQCKQFLRNKFSKDDLISYPSTALAVKKIREEKLENVAAVASMQAAIDYDMDLLASNIEDNKANTTRFLALSKKMGTKESAQMKTSIVFSIKNIPGALFKALSVFALREIDLYKIESRPVLNRGFEYLFYLDFKGDIRSSVSMKAVSHLQEITTFYRLLGSYPVGDVVEPRYRGRIENEKKKEA